MLHRSAGLVGALDVGYGNTLNEALESKPKLLFLLGVDNKELTKEKIPSDCFVVYIGKNKGEHFDPSGFTIYQQCVIFSISKNQDIMEMRVRLWQI